MSRPVRAGVDNALTLAAPDPTEVTVGDDGPTWQPWCPFPGPQTDARDCEADEVFYGGEAGGGKSNLVVGLSLTQHWRSLILRREATQLSEIKAQLLEFAPPGSHWRGIGNGGVMRTPDGREIELAGLPNEDDKRKYQGRPHDLKSFDEVTEFSESQVDFVCGWNRTTKPGQRCRRVLTGNPPLHSGGEWVLRRFGRWLNPRTGPIVPSGHVLWFVRKKVDGRDVEVEVPDGSPVIINGRPVTPRSRTFIRAGLKDNPILSATDYADRIENMPPALRAVLKGDFGVALQDDPWQVIPSAWVIAAQDRWTARPPDGIPLSAVGLDVAYGGSDRTVYVPRHGDWVGPLTCWKGSETDSGEKTAELVAPLVGSSVKAPINVDGIGWGAAAFEALNRNGLKAEAVLFGNGCNGWTDARRVLAFSNIRAFAYWQLRDALDPDLGRNIALPPDPDGELMAELTSARYEMVGGRLKIEAKVDIAARLGRSPDKADAVALAVYDPPKGTWFVEFGAAKAKPRGDGWETHP